MRTAPQGEQGRQPDGPLSALLLPSAGAIETRLAISQPARPTWR
ncbi:hypothetical protein ACFYNW_29730 [Streptomyces virginiae]